jgi:hypothetical protein
MAIWQKRYAEQAARLAALRARETASLVVTADGGKEKAFLAWQIEHATAAQAARTFAAVSAGLWPELEVDARGAPASPDEGPHPRAPRWRCRLHRDTGVIGGQLLGHRLTLLSLRPASSCRALERWWRPIERRQSPASRR